MKKLNYLLLLTLLIINNSCSKDEDNPETWPKHKFKITLDLSGDYKEYEVSTIMQVTSMTKELSKNTQTGEEAYMLITDLVDNYYEFESVKKSMHFHFMLNSNEDSEKEAKFTIKIYLDDELLHEENVIITNFTARTWFYYKGELKKITEFDS